MIVRDINKCRVAVEYVTQEVPREGIDFRGRKLTSVIWREDRAVVCFIWMDGESIMFHTTPYWPGPNGSLCASLH